MLFSPLDNFRIKLQNRVVMAPLTRNRAVKNNTPNALMAEYYGQRATAGLIITEGTSPSANGVGYARIPGMYNAEQVAGWKLATAAVHAKGAKFFLQLMHTGRVTANANLPEGARVVGPTEEICPGEMHTDTLGKQPHSRPHVLTELELKDVVGEYANAAKLAISAGFDGIELHAANGYLLEQFLNANVNTRNDAYGGGASARNRLVLEVASACVAAIGADRVGMRISPYGIFNSTGAFEGVEEQYIALAQELSKVGLLYLHLVDHSSMGAPEVPAQFKTNLRANFKGLFIGSGGFNAESAEAALSAGRCDLVAFGRPFIGNPDLVRRMKEHLPLASSDQKTHYSAGAEGYTDYPEVIESIA